MFVNLCQLYRHRRKLSLLSKGSVPFWLVLQTYVLSVVFALSTNLQLVVLACSSACASCSGTAENCLTCTNRLASGNCASTCPEGSFNSSSTCVTCHGDCAACSGPSFNQCTKCPPNRPVFSNGRCLRTCGSKTQFFDPSLSLCQPCHSSCSSCSAAGSNHCLACSNSSAILQNGACSSSSSPSCIALSSFGMCFTDTQATGPN